MPVRTGHLSIIRCHSGLTNQGSELTHRLRRKKPVGTDADKTQLRSNASEYVCGPLQWRGKPRVSCFKESTDGRLGFRSVASTHSQSSQSRCAHLSSSSSPSLRIFSASTGTTSSPWPNGSVPQRFASSEHGKKRSSRKRFWTKPTKLCRKDAPTPSRCDSWSSARPFRIFLDRTTSTFLTQTPPRTTTRLLRGSELPRLLGGGSC